MTVKELLDKSGFQLLVEGDLSREIEKIYCCDLLSIVMSRAPASCAWVTVMGNVNAAAEASLADMSCGRRGNAAKGKGAGNKRSENRPARV